MCSRWAYFERKFEICQSSSCVVTEVHRLPAYYQQITVHIVSKYMLCTGKFHKSVAVLVSVLQAAIDKRCFPVHGK